jgi:hypothetical protein
MIFTKPLWLIGVGMGLESMRRGFVGGSALSLFVIKEFGLEGQAIPTMTLLRAYLDIEGDLLSRLPPFLAFLFSPYLDYHNSSVTFLAIVDILAEHQRDAESDTCEFYWK